YAIRELLEWLAARQPTVVALDDVHWADAASVEVIAHLLRRVRGPVLGVLAARQRPALLSVGLDEATRRGYCGRVERARPDRPPRLWRSDRADTAERRSGGGVDGPRAGRRRAGHPLPAKRGQPVLPGAAVARRGARTGPAPARG